MMSPDESEELRPQPGLDTRLEQIEQAIGAAKAWIEESEKEIMTEQMMGRDYWDTVYSELQEKAMDETRKSISRLEAEREAILAEQAEFRAWSKKTYGSGDDE